LKTRYSKIFLENSCVLTGVCYDEDILGPIYEFFDKPDDKITFQDLMNNCIYSLCKSVYNEYLANCKEEAIIENIEANDYYFLENGKLA
jgi:hypothetical protein